MLLRSVVRNEVILYIASALTVVAVFALFGTMTGGSSSLAATRSAAKSYQRMHSNVSTSGVLLR